MNSLQRIEPQSTSSVQIQGVISTQELVQRIKRMQEVQHQVMQDGTHYGKLPGCPKPSLWQPGAQVLMVTFNVGSRPHAIEDLSVPDEVRYRVTLEFFHQATGITLGYGVGECSSAEDKYSWRRPVCDDEYETTPEDRRRIKYQKSDNKVYANKQVRTNPADVANTVLKMAKKRALVNGTLDVLAAGEIFTQDIEDLPEGMDVSEQGSQPARAPVQMPKAKSQPQQPTPAAPGNTQTVEDVTIKTGTGSKGEWTKYGIKIGGKTYGTFDSNLGKAAIALKGKPITFTSEADGKFLNLTSIQPANSQPVVEQPESKPTSDEIVISSTDGDIVSEVKRLATTAGLSTMTEINNIIFAEFGIPTLDDITTEGEKILEHFQGMQK